MQVACIPAALEGKDIVARARTGSGKTLAYLLPALHRILAAPRERQRAGWQALIFVPTRELCEQVKGVCLHARSQHFGQRLEYAEGAPQLLRGLLRGSEKASQGPEARLYMTCVLAADGRR